MFISLLEKRRSIRKYKNQQIEQEKMDLLKEAALRSPSSMGRNPWEFVFLTDMELLEKLSRSKPHGASFLKRAPLGVVICADPQKCDVWVEDCSIAAIFLHLAAESIGLGSCWIQIRDRMHDKNKTASDYIKETLKIPSGMEVEAIIAAGYPDEEKPGHRKDELPYERIHLNTF